MNKSLVAIVVVAAAAIAGYVWYSGDGKEIVEGTQEAATGATGAATSAVEDTTEAAGDAAGAVTDAVEGAGAAVTDAVESATDAVQGAVNDASGAATDVTDSAGDATTDAAMDAAGTAADTATEAAASALLTPEAFDPARLGELVEASDLSTVQKATLQTAIAKAAENPELVAGVIEQIRTALGL